ncbi:hypothetical protein BDA96_09G030600 [Sorghum bicolor]|uniref:Uncharacterized protein n=1 Tax=Sorghum bicolor TaxID=4558 RepID=A0A921Q9G9_SORBI|nr:hypothetical protein BDA96_09G030600 [Sorghum bicolor]
MGQVGSLYLSYCVGSFSTMLNAYPTDASSLPANPAPPNRILTCRAQRSSPFDPIFSVPGATTFHQITSTHPTGTATSPLDPCSS